MCTTNTLSPILWENIFYSNLWRSDPLSLNQIHLGGTFSTVRWWWSWTADCRETPWRAQEAESAVWPAPGLLRRHWSASSPRSSPLATCEAEGWCWRCKCSPGRSFCWNNSCSVLGASSRQSRTSCQCWWPQLSALKHRKPKRDLPRLKSSKQPYPMCVSPRCRDDSTGQQGFAPGCCCQYLRWRWMRALQRNLKRRYIFNAFISLIWQPLL